MDASKHSMIHRAAPITQNYLAQNATSGQAEKLSFKYLAESWRLEGLRMS